MSAVADTIAVTPRLPMRERVTLLSALAVITGLSWLYLIRMPMAPADLGALGARLLSVLPPRLADVWLLFMMWMVMMAAMMLPSATPMILAYAAISRGRVHSLAATWLFWCSLGCINSRRLKTPASRIAARRWVSS